MGGRNLAKVLCRGMECQVDGMSYISTGRCVWQRVDFQQIVLEELLHNQVELIFSFTFLPYPSWTYPDLCVLVQM